MAKIGLKYPVYSAATESGTTITYGVGAAIGEAISAKIAVSSNDAKLYADDVLAETDSTFASGTISLNVDDLTDAVKVALLGYTSAAAALDAAIGSHELSAGSSTTPAIVGFGFYGKRVKDGVTSYRAIWLKKVQFMEPAEERNTKGEKTEFSTPTLEGTIFMACDSKWKEEGTFSSEANAILWLQGKAGITITASEGITALTLANTTLTPAFDVAKYNYGGVATDAVTVTATAAGVITLYVDGVFTQTLTTEVASSSIAMAAGACKTLTIIVQETGKTAKTTTITIGRAA